MKIGSNGKLPLPMAKEILEIAGLDKFNTFDKMWDSMWNAYIRNKGTSSTPYWSKAINNAVVFYKVLELLSEEGWITVDTQPNHNWSEMWINEKKLLEHFSMKQLELTRANFKFRKYMLKDEECKVSNLTKINGKVKNTGLVRNGFYATGNVQFQFDTDKLKEYYEVIKAESIKSMSKIRDLYKDMAKDQASYDEVIDAVINNLIQEKGKYRSGQFYSDSRGRNIQGYLNKIFNPVSFKMARALLVIPKESRHTATFKGLHNKYLFIAELMGFKKGTVEDKIDYGRDCYYKQKFHKLNWDRTNEINKINACESFSEETKKKLVAEQLEKAEADRAEMYENIWLERTYEEIDRFLDINKFSKKSARNNYENGIVDLATAKEKIESSKIEMKWQVPIEID